MPTFGEVVAALIANADMRLLKARTAYFVTPDGHLATADGTVIA